MSEGRPPVLGGLSYRRLDRLSKLLGVGFVASGLHVGGGSTAGIALGLLGVACVLLPVALFPAADGDTPGTDSDGD